MGESQYIILAGGEGKRLRPYTLGCPKPLLRFGAGGRIIDFTLRNCLRSQSARVLVLTQYLGEMVRLYCDREWGPRFRRRGAELRVLDGGESGAGRFEGTAHAVREALSLSSPRPRRIVVLSGDHVYGMDYRPLLDFHAAGKRTAAVAAVECEPTQAGRFGVLVADASGRVRDFREKPRSLEGLTAAGQRPLASMGVYVFEVDRLLPVLERCAAAGRFDFGSHVLPALVADGEAQAFRFRSRYDVPGYWRDIGTVSSYWGAQMELVRGLATGMEDELWREVDDGSFISQGWSHCAKGQRMRISDSVIAGRVVVGAARIHHSVIAPGARINDGAVVVRSVVLDGATVAPGARLCDLVVGSEGIIKGGRGHDAARKSIAA